MARDFYSLGQDEWINELTDLYCAKVGIKTASTKREVWWEVQRIHQIWDWGNNQPEALYRGIIASKLNVRELVEILEEVSLIE